MTETQSPSDKKTQRPKSSAPRGSRSSGLWLFVLVLAGALIWMGYQQYLQTARIAALNAALTQTHEQPSYNMRALQEDFARELNSLNAELQSLRTEMASRPAATPQADPQLQARLQQLESRIQQRGSQNQAIIKLYFAIDRLMTGEQGALYDVFALAESAAASEPQLIPAIQQLKTHPFAQTPSAATLAASFESVIPAVLDQHERESREGWYGYARSVFGSFVKIRHLGDDENLSPTERALNRSEKFLAEGNVPAALEASRNIEVRSPALDLWQHQAELHVRQREMLAAFRQTLENLMAGA